MAFNEWTNTHGTGNWQHLVIWSLGQKGGDNKAAKSRETLGEEYPGWERNAWKSWHRKIVFRGCYSSVPIQETTSMTTLVLVCLSMVTAAEWGTHSRLWPSTASRRSPHFSFPSWNDERDYETSKALRLTASWLFFCRNLGMKKGAS